MHFDYEIYFLQIKKLFFLHPLSFTLTLSKAEQVFRSYLMTKNHPPPANHIFVLQGHQNF